MKKILVCVMSIMMVAVMAAFGNEETENRKVSGGTDNITMSTGLESRESENVNAATDLESEDISKEKDDMEGNTMKITVGNTTFTAVLAEGPLTINMSDYASMEKVGLIGTELVRNDEQITTGAGDIILYQGNSLAIYYDANSWNFTRIGKIDDVTREELLEVFGDGDVAVMFSLE